MSGAAKACPRCGNSNLISNCGIDGHHAGHLVHGTVHAGRHGNPVNLALGTVAIALAVLFPKKYTCGCCNHVFKA